MSEISPEQVGDKAIQSAKWYFSLNLAQKLIFFCCTIILARLLTPAEFGLAAISMTLDLLIWLVISFGINAAIIHFQDNLEERLNAAFWLFILSMGVVSGGLIVIAPLAGSFYKAPIIEYVVSFSAIALLIYSFGATHKAILYREMNFKKISILDALLNTLTNVLFVIFAMSGCKVWSFIYPKIFIAIICVVSLWKMTDWRPKLEFNFKYWLEMFNYGKNVLAGNIMDFLLNNSTHVLIGSIVGPAVLGIYSFANDKSMMMINNLSHPAAMVSFPAYSRIQDHPEKLKDAFVKTIKGIALLSFPYTFWQLVIGPEYVLFFYGKKWEPSIVLFQMLIIYTMFKTVSHTGNSLLQGIGKPDIVVKWNLIYTPLLLAMIFVGYKTAGIYGITALISFLGGMSAIIYLIMIFKLLKMSAYQLFETLLPAMSGSIIAGITLFALKLYIKTFDISGIYLIVLSIPVGVTVYIISLKLLFPEVYDYVAENINKLITKNKIQTPAYQDIEDNKVS